MMTAMLPAQKHKTTRTLAVAVTALAALAGCGSGSSTGSAANSEAPDAGGPLSVLIASSGSAESEAVKTAVADWSATSGTKASVNVASDLPQQLSQGFASGKPADVFYVSADQLANYARNGSLEPYGDQLANKDDFYPALRQAFTPRDDSAARAARQLVGFDADLPVASCGGSGDDAVVGQVEEDGGSVGCDPGRLVVLFRLNARHTHPSRATGPFVFSDTDSVSP